jgi:HAD superfamily hydrolase (TIGR01509 family)
MSVESGPEPQGLTAMVITVEPHIEGLIFDCDGTLGDTMPIHRETWDDIFRELGRVYPRAFWGQFNGMPSKKIIELYNEEFGDTLDAESLSRLKEERVRPRLSLTRPIQAVVDVVLDHHGRLPMAVASGSCRANVHAVLDALSIKGHFQAVLTSDDPITPKPAPDLFLAAAAAMGVSPSRCLVFEDGDAGLSAANAAGMAAIDVRPYQA